MAITTYFRSLIERAQGEPRVPHVVFVNDLKALQRDFKRLGQKLLFDVECLYDHIALEKYLKRFVGKDDVPDAFFLDVVGVGANTAQYIYDWFDKNRPHQALPEIHFFSSCESMSVSEAGNMRARDPRFSGEFASEGEIAWLSRQAGLRALFSGRNKAPFPQSKALREVLNRKLGSTYSLECNEKYEEYMRNIGTVGANALMGMWGSGKVKPGQIIERFRSLAENVINAYKQNLYQGADDVEADANFYASAGSPVKGRVCFSIDEIEHYGADDGSKPILLMQRYDPSVVPLLSQQKLGGVIVLSPYMASHLKFLCEANMVSGLFGLKKEDKKTLSGGFNEAIKPDCSPYFAGDNLEIAGHSFARGQELAMCLGDAGLVSDQEKLSSMGRSAPSVNPREEKSNLSSRDFLNLDILKQVFGAYFKQVGLVPFSYKVNVDSLKNKFLGTRSGIGLVRTEQLLSSGEGQPDLIKPYLLGGNKDGLQALGTMMTDDYKELIRRKGDDAPIRIRLFDLPVRELLTTEEQKQFYGRYKSLDVNGGDALAAWPELYRLQIGSILDAAGESWSDLDEIEIMMPSVKTEQDALVAKRIVEEEIKFRDMSPKVKFGVMLETKEACSNVEALTRHCDFFSFGTNDLTQDHFDIQRGDLVTRSRYKDQQGYDPFEVLAPDVFDIVEDTIRRARKVKPEMQIDICGAQAADYATAERLFEAGINNISVAPNIKNLYVTPLQMGYDGYDLIEGEEPLVAVEQQRHGAQSQPAMNA